LNEDFIGTDPSTWDASVYYDPEYEDTLEDKAKEHVYTHTNGEFSPDQKLAIIDLIVGFKVEEQEPDSNSYRASSKKMLFLLSCMDTLMESTPNKEAAWKMIAFSLGLQSVSGLTEGQVAHSVSVGRAAFSKSVTAFLRSAMIQGNFGLKSKAANSSYSNCARKNRKKPESIVL
jgi:hypothetical protein